MSKLKGLLLTEGLHGMISQVEGLAKALDLDYFHEKIELNIPWNLIPPSLTPKKKFVFKNQINAPQGSGFSSPRLPFPCKVVTIRS